MTDNQTPRSPRATQTLVLRDCLARSSEKPLEKNDLGHKESPVQQQRFSPVTISDQHDPGGKASPLWLDGTYQDLDERLAPSANQRVKRPVILRWYKTVPPGEKADVQVAARHVTETLGSGAVVSRHIVLHRNDVGLHATELAVDRLAVCF